MYKQGMRNIRVNLDLTQLQHDSNFQRTFRRVIGLNISVERLLWSQLLKILWTGYVLMLAKIFFG